MTPRIEILQRKKLIGKRISMSFIDNKTFLLWNGFMARKKEIQNSIGTDLYSLEVFPPSYFSNFDPSKTFEKWAAVEVSDLNTIPNEMETLIIPTGLYAVFIHKGPASEGERTYNYIFREWLPTSKYSVDDRPHYTVMGAKYKKDDPNNEEEIWIPIMPKT